MEVAASCNDNAVLIGRKMQHMQGEICYIPHKRDLTVIPSNPSLLGSNLKTEITSQEDQSNINIKP